MKTLTSCLAPGILALITACGSLSDLNSDQLNQPGAANAASDEATAADLSGTTRANGPKEPDVSFLSEAAQAALGQVRTLHESIRSQVDGICKPDETLRAAIKAAADAIRQDTARSDEDRHAAIQAVFAEYEAQITADRTRMDTCQTENEAALAVWRDLGKSLHDACMLPRKEGSREEAAQAGQGLSQGQGPGHGPHGRGHGGPGGHAPLTDAQKQEFEAKLTGAACAQAIAETQAKLP